MKSSTIRRSTLSKESMEVIEALARDNENEGTIGEYVRPEEIEVNKDNDTTSKAQEIDLLWQNFKSSQFTSNSPTAYILMGFIAGVVLTLLTMFCIGYFSSKTSGKPFTFPFFGNKTQVEQTIEQDAQETVDAKVSVPEETEQQETVQNEKETPVETSVEEPKIDTSKMKKYVVKSGDTGESIIKHFYGSYTPERAEKIIKANNLKNLDRINIDQELFIPAE